MKKSFAQPADADELRRRAEEQLREKRKMQGAEGSDQGAAVDAARLQHELEVHQIELEMQNQALEAEQERIKHELERYAELFDFAPVGYCNLTSEGTIVMANFSSAKLLGLSRSEMVGRRMGLFVADADRKTFGEHLKATFVTGTGRTCEVGVLIEGQPRLTVEMVFQLFDDGLECRVAMVDITSRKRAEEALKQSRSLLEAVTEGTSDAVYVKDTQGRYVLFNAAAGRFVNKTCEEVLGTDDTALFPPDEARRLMEAEQRIMKSGEVQTYEEVVTTGGGVVRTFFATKGPIRDAQGRVSGLFGISRDITERKQAEVALQKSEESFRTVADFTYDMEYWRLADGRLFYVSPSCERITGYAAREFLEDAGLLVRIVHPEDREMFERHFNPHEEGPAEVDQHEIEFRIQTRSGEDRWIGHTCQEVVGRDGKSLGRRAANRDITNSKRSQFAMEQAKSLLAATLESTADGLLVADGHGKVVSLNQRFLELWRISPELAASRDDEKLLQHVLGQLAKPSAFLANVRELYADPSAESFDELGFVDGRVFERYSRPQWLVGKIVGRVWSFRDVTEKRRLEAQNRALQKSESLGRMAGAIAHHFNNQLAVVIGNLDLLISNPTRKEELAECLSEAMSGARKAAEMSGQMLTYLGLTHGQREPQNLAELCRKQLPEIHAVMPKGVSLKTDLAEPGPVIEANESQVMQVISSLLTNAWEACGKERGHINLSVKTVRNIPGTNRFPMEWQPKDATYACLEVSDTGSGIAAGDIERVFDPFYSSKFVGRGLGLAVVVGIAREHGGCVVVESEPGRGSVFRVFFPLMEEATPQKPVAMPPTRKASGGGTVLVVEDEELVAKLVTRVLQRAGYRVIVAKDGLEGVELTQQHEGEICLAVLDLVMPRMDGWETLAVLRKLRPGIPVILCSGYDEVHAMAGDHAEQPQAFLGKPYAIEALMKAVGRAVPAG